MPAEPIRFLDLAAVLRQTTLSKSTVYALMSDGQFPRPCRIGRRASRWDAGEVDQWMRDRLAERAAA